MLSRIEAAHERQRHFVSDASHELRSPLANEQALVEVALRAAGPGPVAGGGRGPAGGAGPDAPARRRPAPAGPARRAGARAPPGGGPRRRRPRAGRPAAQARPGAGGGRRRCRPCACSATPTSSRRVVRNLVDNAARHARTTVIVSLRPADGRGGPAGRRRRRRRARRTSGSGSSTASPGWTRPGAATRAAAGSGWRSAGPSRPRTAAPSCWPRPRAPARCSSCGCRCCATRWTPCRRRRARPPAAHPHVGGPDRRCLNECPERKRTASLTGARLVTAR